MPPELSYAPGPGAPSLVGLKSGRFAVPMRTRAECGRVLDMGTPPTPSSASTA